MKGCSSPGRSGGSHTTSTWGEKGSRRPISQWKVQSSSGFWLTHTRMGWPDLAPSSRAHRLFWFWRVSSSAASFPWGKISIRRERTFCRLGPIPSSSISPRVRTGESGQMFCRSPASGMAFFHKACCLAFSLWSKDSCSTGERGSSSGEQITPMALARVWSFPEAAMA